MDVTDFDRWVGNNNIPTTFEYGKGWWDCVETVRRLACTVDATGVRVVGHFIVNTPPPREQLPMPAVAIDTPVATFGLRNDFGDVAVRNDFRDWTVSVDRRAPYTGSLFGVLSETEDLRSLELDGLPPSLMFGPYCENHAQFSVLLHDDWDVAFLLRMMAYAT